MDQYTKEAFDSQMIQQKTKDFMSCYITPRMNMHLKLQKTKLDIIKNDSYLISPVYDNSRAISNINTLELTDFIDSSFQTWGFTFDEALGGYRIRCENTSKGAFCLARDSDSNKVVLDPYVTEPKGAENQLWVLQKYQNDTSYLIRSKRYLLYLSLARINNLHLADYVSIDSVWDLESVNSWEINTYYIAPKTDIGKRLDFQSNKIIVSDSKLDVY